MSALSALSSNVEKALAAKDEDGVIVVFKAQKLDDEDIAAINSFFTDKKISYRKRYVSVMRDKPVTSAVAGKFLNDEILRLIKENRVEDDLDYTKACIEAAAQNKNPDLIYAVAPFLVHPRSELRAEANKVVAAKRDERIYPLIGQLLAGENTIDKIYAMETLLALKDERAVPLLLLQLSNANKNVRYYSLKTLEAIASDKAQFGVIHLAEVDSDEEVRLKAIEVLRPFKTGPVFSALQRLLSDKNLAVRTCALESALAQNNKNYANAISEQLTRETEPAQKHALLQGLFRLGSGGGMNGVLALLKRESDSELLLWASFACTRFSESRCADDLAALIGKATTEAVRVEALTALGVFRQRKHLGTLFSTLSDTKQTDLIRSAALAAIGSYDSEATLSPLFEIYAHENNQSVRVQIKSFMDDLMKRKLPKLANGVPAQGSRMS
ncbi:MAG: HEAT repeat domain-containing protein [Spirochaetes bacterium]|nr:HEAT repeat domain-containing protein [Spirochaetota bacterium]